MSGASLPYHLRPHKAVDRRLFLDLLARFERWLPLSKYVYLSMGAYPLEDHKLMHRIVGIRRLIAFDFDSDVVARQHFNRPIDTCHCIESKSADVIDKLDSVLEKYKFSNSDGLIVWLDYTSPKQIGLQIREFQALLDKLGPGDIVRVTVNAQPYGLLDPLPEDAKPTGVDEKREAQFRNLKARIGAYLPASTTKDDMTVEGLPRVLAGAFAAAALAAFPVSKPSTFCPLSIVRYADAQQMLSITGTVVNRKQQQKMLKQLHMRSWPFSSTDWSAIHELVVPDLTLRERLFLERGIFRHGPKKLIKQLGFENAADLKISDVLSNYKKYSRFYPTLLSAEL